MAFSLKTWAKVRKDYERGISIPALAEKYTISIPAIKLRSNQWEKGKLLPVIEKRIEEGIVEKFTKIGMPLDRVIECIAGGIEEPQRVVFEGKGDQMIATPEPDYPTRLKYIQEYNKMTGSYAPEKSIALNRTLLEIKETHDLTKLSADQLEMLIELQERMMIGTDDSTGTDPDDQAEG